MDYNLWQELILGATKPFRTGANILAQNWGSALTGKDMSQQENQGRFLRWLSEGITPEEQQVINEKPYLSALKSGAGMASTLAPFGTQGLRAAQFASNPLTNRLAQLTSQGALEGSMGGFGYSREGKEVEDTLLGTGLGIGGELLADYITNPQFRKMLSDASTFENPNGTSMYRGALGDDDNIMTFKDPYKKKIAPNQDNYAKLTDSMDDEYVDPLLVNTDAPDMSYAPDKELKIINSADYDDSMISGGKIDMLRDDPIARLEIEAKKYATPDEFVEAQGETLYHGTSADFEPSDFKGGYLTGDKNYAEVYKNPSASSISYGEAGIKNKKSGQPRVLEYFVDKDANIFDYTNPKHRNLLNDYFGDWSMSGNPVVGKSGQLDWTEGENLIEFFDEKGIKFDGIKLDEGGGFDPETRIELKRAPSVRIINPKVLKTKSQLIDIWNKAHNLKDSAKELRGGFKEILDKAIKKVNDEPIIKFYQDYLDPENPVIDLTNGTQDVKNNLNSTYSDILNNANKYNATDNLIQEAKKYKTPGEFVKARGGGSSYTAESIGKTRANTTPYNPKVDESFAEPEISGNKIRVFRATTNNRLLPGDFVTTHENTAKNFTKSGGKDSKIISEWIPISDLHTTFNGYQVYKPGGLSSLEDLWKKAWGK